MTTGIQEIQVRKQRGKIMIQAIGRTGRGVKYLKKEIPVKVKKTSDKNFKKEQAAAVLELFGSGE